LVLLCGPAQVCADTLQLKDNAAITGRILSEKNDSVAVDVGYTVLVVPRGSIAKIARGDAAEPGSKPGKTTKPVKSPAAPTSKPALESKSDFYVTATKPLPERNVRDLVSQLGEAVLQVRTPSSLGSGFLINNEGYLITNFHVIEGESQISIEVFLQRSGQLERK